MAYDSGLAQRIIEKLGNEPGYMSQKMFDGMCYLLDGNMACGVIEDALIVHIGPQAYTAALQMKHAIAFDYSGRPMSGWVKITSAGIVSDKALHAWIERGVLFARSLPAK